MVSNSDAKADTVYFDLPAYTILKPVKDAFAAKYKEWCDSCALDNVDVPITSVGKDMPDRVVSYPSGPPEVTSAVRLSLGAAQRGHARAALKIAGVRASTSPSTSVTRRTPVVAAASEPPPIALDFAGRLTPRAALVRAPPPSSDVDGRAVLQL